MVSYETVGRRLALWTVVCSVSAAPSFLLASIGRNDFSQPAMVLGVACFILAYTACTSTDAFERFHARPFVRRTLYIGYGVRMLLSLAYPIGTTADALPGMISVRLVELAGLEPRSFFGTFATTIVQGALLNVIVFCFMLVVYALQRAFAKAPPEARRGFAVLPPVAAVNRAEEG